MAKWRKRQDPGYDEFVKAVRKRDKNKCQMPGCKKRRKLQVHHILEYSKYVYLRTDPGNAILLCESCHKSIKGKEMYYSQLFNSIINAKR
jgi:5-methylcytosine-specific restriction endonuclease McrA